MNLKQYELYWANLDPTIGSEINKTRPVIIVSPDAMNTQFNRIVICPLTTVLHPEWATRVACKCGNKEAEIAVDQIRSIDIRRLYKKIGKANSNTISEIKNTIRILFM